MYSTSKWKREEWWKKTEKWRGNKFGKKEGG